MSKHIKTVCTAENVSNMVDNDVHDSKINSSKITSPIVISHKINERLFKFVCTDSRCSVKEFVATAELCNRLLTGTNLDGNVVHMMACLCPECNKEYYSSDDVSKDHKILDKINDIIK